MPQFGIACDIHPDDSYSIPLLHWAPTGYSGYTYQCDWGINCNSQDIGVTRQLCTTTRDIYMHGAIGGDGQPRDQCVDEDDNVIFPMTAPVTVNFCCSIDTQQCCPSGCCALDEVCCDEGCCDA